MACQKADRSLIVRDATSRVLPDEFEQLVIARMIADGVEIRIVLEPQFASGPTCCMQISSRSMASIDLA